MKVAIVCDWLVTLGGAEKVLRDIITCFPNADLFAVIDFLSPEQRKTLLNKKAKTTFIQKMPFAKTKYRHYLPLMTIAIEQFDLSEYDLIISSSHAVAKGVITGPHQTHISYIHSPMRYAWDLQHQYLRETGLDRKVQGLLARYFLHKLRIWDARSAHNVDHFITNSHFIARRVQKAYRRPAEIIYPSVDTKQFVPSLKKKEDFYLTASRLVPYKKIDIIIESFNTMPHKKLIVIGDGPDYKKLKHLANDNVNLLGYQPDEVLIDYMQRAKAFLFAAEEDFGIIPLEAQSCGTPVIAYGKGGTLETICAHPEKNPSGVFFQEQSPASICAAVEYFEQHCELFARENCVNNAARFSRARFKDQFTQFVNAHHTTNIPT